MAAEYTLYTKNKIREEDVEELLERLGWRSIEEKLSSHVTLLSFSEKIGFQIYFNSTFETSIEIENKEWDSLKALIIRFDTESDVVRSKRNMIRFIVEINKVSEEDFILLFNGENVIMAKELSTGLILSNSDFWTKELIEELGDWNFRRKTFNIL